jgi:phosphatidylglycerol:prolipoprotein diacylglycerol transferase
MNYYAIFIILSLVGLIYLAKKTTSHLFNKEFFWKLVFFTFIFSLIGAKIFHVIENFSFYSSAPNLIFSSYGYSVLGAITFGYLSIFFISIIYKANFIHITDRVLLLTPLAQFIGRIGNITNEELMPFSIYEMGFNIINFTILLIAYRFKKIDGLVTSLFFLNYGIIRLYIEILKGNSLGFLTLISFIFFIYGVSKLVKIILKL